MQGSTFNCGDLVFKIYSLSNNEVINSIIFQHLTQASLQPSEDVLLY